MIGIIGAMDIEVEMLLEKIADRKELQVSQYKFNYGKIFDKDVVILKSGIGKVASAIGASLMIEKFHPDFIINTGITGGVKGLHTRDILIADRFKYGDVDARNFGYQLGQVPEMPLYYLADENVVLKISKILQNNNYDFKKGEILTSDTFVTDFKQIKFDNLASITSCEMEGTSIAQACYLLATPFASIRFISDVVGTKEQVKDYASFEKEMAHRSADICLDIIKEYKL